MHPEDRVINGFWDGGPLGEVGRMSIASFLAHGHRYRLWIYKDPGDLPWHAEFEIRDAAEIVPREVYERWFPPGDASDQRKHKLPTFSNFFRYSLIHREGGWWCDLDSICLRPFDFGSPYVFCGQYFSDPANARREGVRIIAGVFRAPAGAGFLASLLDRIKVEAEAGKDPGWGVWGPRLFTEHVHALGLMKYKTPENVFAPFPPGEEGVRLQYESPTVEPPPWAYALHLFNRFTMDMAGRPGSLYDRMRRRYLGD